MVGAIVGLLARLASLIKKRNLERDFGLNMRHVLGAQVLSGVASVGVTLVGYCHISLGGLTLGQATASAPPALPAIFDFGRNTGAIVIAMMFRLTPELLIRYLHTPNRRADREPVQ